MRLSRVRREQWWLLGLAVLVIGAGWGWREPWPADEPRFALAARQMVESGQWLFPMRGDELYPDKPPLFMWLQAASFLLLRDWRLAFLLPSLLAALGTVWLTYDLGRRLWRHRVGLHAGYALLFTLQFTLQAKRAQIDASITFLITLAVYALLRHLLRGPDPRRALLGFAAAGLGVITKGVGVVALLLLLPAGWARLRRWRGVQPLRPALLLGGMLVFLGAISSWLAPMLLAVQASGDPALHAYADDILRRQTAERYGNSWHHHQPPWYFLQVIASAWLPVALALPWALPAWWRRLRRGDVRYLLLLGWIALVLVFFSLPSGKRDVYILPALPMFCLALAPLLPGLLRKRGPRRLLLAFTLLLALLGLGGGAAALLGEPSFEQRLELDRGLPPGADAVWWLLLAIGAAALGAAAWGRLRRAAPAAMLALSALWILASFVGYPLLDGASSGRALMQRVAARIGPDAELALVAWKEQYLLQADRPVRTFGFRTPVDAQRAAARDWLAQDPARRWLLLQESALGPCVQRARAQFVGVANRRRWWLLRDEALVPGCG